MIRFSVGIEDAVTLIQDIEVNMQLLKIKSLKGLIFRLLIYYDSND